MLGHVIWGSLPRYGAAQVCADVVLRANIRCECVVSHSLIVVPLYHVYIIKYIDSMKKGII